MTGVTDSRMAPLFDSFSMPGLDLENRIAMAPMTRMMSPGGVPGQNVADYYKRRVEGGCNFIITEATTVAQDVASFDPNTPNIHTPEALAGWKKTVDAVHSAGGKVAPQLWHTGMARKQGTGDHPDKPSLGPSGLAAPGKKVHEPMTDAEVQDCIDAFAKGAAASKEIGFDAIEIHGAHGYLIDQFFWEGTNERGDSYGGDMVERTRFGVEIIKAIRAAVGPNYPIILRISQWKQQDFDVVLAPNPQELEKFLAPLTDAGVDMYHCSTRRFWEPEFEGSDLNLAGWAKKLTGKPSMTVGSVGLDKDMLGFDKNSAEVMGIEKMDELMERLVKGEFDLVAIGRALLVDADWGNKVREGNYDQLRPYTPEVMATLD